MTGDREQTTRAEQFLEDIKTHIRVAEHWYRRNHLTREILVGAGWMANVLVPFGVAEKGDPLGVTPLGGRPARKALVPYAHSPYRALAATPGTLSSIQQHVVSLMPSERNGFFVRTRAGTTSVKEPVCRVLLRRRKPLPMPAEAG